MGGLNAGWSQRLCDGCVSGCSCGRQLLVWPSVLRHMPVAQGTPPPGGRVGGLNVRAEAGFLVWGARLCTVLAAAASVASRGVAGAHTRRYLKDMWQASITWGWLYVGRG